MWWARWLVSRLDSIRIVPAGANDGCEMANAGYLRYTAGVGLVDERFTNWEEQ